MASTYSQNLKIELMGSGDQVGSWGATTNDNLGTAIEEAIVGYGAVQFTNDANLTISLSNSNASQLARNFFLYMTSSVTLTAQRDLIVPTIDKTYTVHNNTTGGQAIRVKTTAGTGIVVPSGKKMVLYVDGTNVIEQVDYITALTVGTLSISSILPVASGGTGLGSLTANNVILGNGTSVPNFVAPSTNGNVLTSNGTTWTSAAIPTPFITGMIMLWSGSIASIPSGWALCNGSGGTPDLRDRFVVGAGSSYAVNATGGATTVTLSTANMPAHTHSIAGSGTTSNQSNGHTHTYSGTTSGQSQTHTHSISVSDPGHRHDNAVPINESNLAPFGTAPTNLVRELTMGGNDAVTWWTSTVTTGITASAGNASQDHTHTFSGTTSDISANHTHTFSFSGTSGSAGSGSAFSILPPYYALAYIMKT
jgi:microcystin-dependent protein